MIKKIVFKNYKAFKEEQTLELRPITLLIGKNSSGKTSVCNLIHMLSQSLSTPVKEDLVIQDNMDAFVRGGGILFHRGDYTSLEISGINESDASFVVDYLFSDGKTYLTKLESHVNGSDTNTSFDEQTRAEINNSLYGALKYINVGNQSFAFTVNHILPIRHAGINILKESMYAPKEVSGDGKGAYDMLMHSYIHETPLYRNVSQWFVDNLEDQRLRMVSFASPDSKFYLFMVGHNEIPIEHVGQGFQQVLPIIVETYNENASNVTIIEQPALHLHPAAHAAVMHRIAESAKQLNRNYVIESHSENMLLELRRMISDPQCNLNPEDVIVYYIDMVEGVSYLKPIFISAEGELSFWPTGVFGESFELLSQIMQNRL